MDFQRIIPAPPSHPLIEIFESHRLTHEFYQEVEYRDEFKAYCQWYRETALKHKEELDKMQGDINIFGWFLGKR